MSGMFALQAYRVIIVLLSGLLINCVCLKDIYTNFRGLDYISVSDLVFYRVFIGIDERRYFI